MPDDTVFELMDIIHLSVDGMVWLYSCPANELTKGAMSEMVHLRVRLITRGGYDWTKRYPWIAESALKNR